MQPQTLGSRAGQESTGLVLLMDDDDLLREALRDLLERRGYQVEACADAAEGLLRLRGGLAPQVILLDLRMPGIDGWEFRLIQKADARWSEIPLIALSADRSPKAASIDAEAFLAKPLDDRTLLQTVERMVRLAEGRAGMERAGEITRLRDMGAMATGISDQLAPSLTALVESLKLAQHKAADLERRLNASDAFSLVGVRQLMESAERHAERARGVLSGVSLFCQLALHTLSDRRRVLIIHGEERLAAVLRDALEEDHEVLTVPSGREALRVLADDSFDVLLCELALRDVHGIDIYEQLITQRPEQAQRMVFLTSEGAFGERERAFFARHRPWQLRAPFHASDVRELIEAQWRSFH